MPDDPMPTDRVTAPLVMQEARLLIRNEFSNLDIHQQYFNAYARLQKKDPLNRTLMLGTDQRDKMVPAIKRILADLGEAPKTILDIGCGDGATFELFSDSVPQGSKIDILDPNPDYIDAYTMRLHNWDNITLRQSITEDFSPNDKKDSEKISISDDYDIIFVIHSLYFFLDLFADFAFLYEKLRPDGVMIVIFADETVSFTGACFAAYTERYDRQTLEAHKRACAERLSLLGDKPHANIGSDPVFTGASITVERQDTRLYGHSIGDLIALSNISGLIAYEGVEKFDAAADILSSRPERVSLRVELDASTPRYGMLSVGQPQLIGTIRKPS